MISSAFTLNQNFRCSIPPKALEMLPNDPTIPSWPDNGCENCAAAADESSCCHCLRINSVISNDPIQIRRTESIESRSESAFSCAGVQTREAMISEDGRCLWPLLRSCWMASIRGTCSDAACFTSPRSCWYCKSEGKVSNHAVTSSDMLSGGVRVAPDVETVAHLPLR